LFALNVPNSGANFANKSKLDGHFESHGAEFGAKSADEYLSIAQDVMKNGMKVQYPYKGETRTGYIQLMGNNRKGQSKFAFVGTNNQGQITTLHTKSGKDVWKTLNNNAADKMIYLAP
jgi:pyocin large subunit-like protein